MPISKRFLMHQEHGRIRLLPLWIVTLLAIIVGVVILQKHPAREERSRDNSGLIKTTLRLKWLWYAGWAGELVATENNIWAEYGLSVHIEPGGFELDPIKIVASGTNDIGVAGADQILLAREKGIPLVAFATQFQVTPVGFVSKKSSLIRTIADFKGKRVGVKYGTDVEPVYRTLLSIAGLSEEDVKEFPVKFDLLPFFSDAVDVYPGYLTNDLLIPEERGYEVNTIRAIDAGVTVYGNVYFCTERFLSRNGKMIRRFYEAIKSAWERALTMPPESVASLALKVNRGLNIAHETTVVRSLRPYIIPEGTYFGEMTESAWKSLYDLLRKQGVLAADFDYRSCFTLDVLKEAHR